MALKPLHRPSEGPDKAPEAARKHPITRPGLPVFLTQADMSGAEDLLTEARPAEPETARETAQAGSEAAAGGTQEAAAEEAPAEEAVVEVAEAAEETAPAGAGAAAGTPAGRASAPAGGAGAPEPPDRRILPRLPRVRASDLNAIRAPIVLPPPRQAIEKSRQILKSTGATPEAHHAQIQQAVFRVAEAAREAQRQLVWRIDGIAMDARWSIEGMAARIDGIVAQCCGLINSTARSVERQISTVEAAQEREIVDHSEDTSRDLREVNDQVSTEVERLLLTDASQELIDAHTRLVNHYTGHAGTAKESIKAIPQGNGPPQPVTSSRGGGEFQSALGEGATLTSFNDAQTVIMARLMTERSNKIVQYGNRYCAAALPSIISAQQAAYQSGTNQRADALTSPGAIARFTITSLGLVAPTAQAAETDEEQDKTRLKKEIKKQYGPLSQAKMQALSGMRGKMQRVRNALDPANRHSIPFSLTKGLNKTGKQVKQGLMDQALVIERSLRTTTADMAAAYPNLVARLAPMVQTGDFLDQRRLIPRLEQAIGTVKGLRAGQVSAVQNQANAAVRQNLDAFTQQVAKLRESAADGAQSLRRQLIPATFDFELMAAQFTGQVDAGLRAATEQARGFATDVARGLLRPVATGSKFLDRTEEKAVQYLNGNIAQEYGGFLRTVGEIEKKQLGGDGSSKPFDQTKRFGEIRLSQKGDLRHRINQIQTALPERNTGLIVVGMIGGVLAAPFTGGASLAITAAAGYEAYRTDPDEDDVSTALGIPWPGPIALNRLCLEEGVWPDVQRLIDARMDEPERSATLLLFSSNAGDRNAGRLRLINASNTLGGISDSAREALLRSITPEERDIMTPAELARMQRTLRADLKGTDLNIQLSYLNGEPDRALAYRIQQRIDRARQEGNHDMFQSAEALQSMVEAEIRAAGGRGTVPPEQMRAMLDGALVELQDIRDPRGRHVGARDRPSAQAPTNLRTIPASVAQQTPGLAPAPPQPAAPARRDRGGGPAAPPPAPAREPAAPPALPARREPARRRDEGAEPGRGKAARRTGAAPDQPQLTPEDARRAMSAGVPAADPRRSAVASERDIESARASFLSYATAARRVNVGGVRDVAGIGGAAMIGLPGVGQIYGGYRVYKALDRGVLDASDYDPITGDAIIPVDDRVRNHFAAVIDHGPNSMEARATRAAYVHARGQSRWGGLTNNDQVAINNAFSDPAFNRARAKWEEARNRVPPNPAEIADAGRAYEQAREQHERFLAAVAAEIESGGEPRARAAALSRYQENPTAARRFVTDRLGNVLAKEHSDDRAAAGEIVDRGRISIGRGVEIAARGWGTNDDLLKAVMGGRTRYEMQTAEAEWDRTHSESLREFLGVGNRGLSPAALLTTLASPALGLALYGGEFADYFSGETSGDLANELEVMMLGDPENDAQRAERAHLIARQQREEGTGFIAQRTMEGAYQTAYLADRRNDMGQRILDAARANKNSRGVDLPTNLMQVFNPDGTIRDNLRRLAFDNKGNLLGDGPTMGELTQGVEDAAQFYRAEIDRQESVLTGFITAIAIVVSVLLLLIPGVNVVAAGILTALIAGAATITVKLGMRGGRYGWEEMATDMAKTGIEAATAGFGGAMAGGLGRAGMAGRLAGFGDKLTKTFGRVGGAAVREGLVSAASGAANTALDDRIWDDGIDRGIGRVIGGGLRGAATGFVSGGVSEGITRGLGRRLNPGVTKPENLKALQRLGPRLGPAGRDAVAEIVSSTAGGLSAEGINILADIAEGKFKGGWSEALKRLGKAGLKDLVSSAGRAGARNYMRRRYNDMVAAARASDGEVTDAQARMIRRLGISAGVLGYDSTPGQVRGQIMAARQVIATLPAGVRRRVGPHLATMDIAALQQVGEMLRTGDMGDATARKVFIDGLKESNPELDLHALMKDLHRSNSDMIPVRAEREAAAAAAVRAEKALRGSLIADVDGPARAALAKMPVEMLSVLPPDAQKMAAEMIGRGRMDDDTASMLLARARAENAGLDALGFLNQLRDLAEAAGTAQQAARAERIARREEMYAAAPNEHVARLIDTMPDRDLALLARALGADVPDPKHVDAAMRMLARRMPGMSDESIGALFGAMLTNARRGRAETAAIRAQEERTARVAQMDNVPEAHRPLMSTLPDDALLTIRLAQQDGEPLPAAKIDAMIALAKRGHPEVEVTALRTAIAETVATPGAARPSWRERWRRRRELMTFVPPAARSAVRGTRILGFPDAVFAAYARSGKGNAVTIELDGVPVVIIRKGADPSVLREEGVHLTQRLDTEWAARIGELDERTMAEWDSLPAERKVALYRTKIDAEIDAQRRMIAELRARRDAALFPWSRRRLQAQLDLAEGTLRTLSNRAAEVATYTPAKIRAIEAGTERSPDWLDQPARLFNKEGGPESLTAEASKLLGTKLDPDSPEHQRLMRVLALVRGRIPADQVADTLKGITDPGDAVAKLRKEFLSGGGGRRAQLEAQVADMKSRPLKELQDTAGDTLDRLLEHALSRNTAYRDEAAAVLLLAQSQDNQAMTNTLARARQALAIEGLKARSTGALLAIAATRPGQTYGEFGAVWFFSELGKVLPAGGRKADIEDAILIEHAVQCFFEGSSVSIDDLGAMAKLLRDQPDSAHRIHLSDMIPIMGMLAKPGAFVTKFKDLLKATGADGQVKPAELRAYIDLALKGTDTHSAKSFAESLQLLGSRAAKPLTDSDLAAVRGGKPLDRGAKDFAETYASDPKDPGQKAFVKDILAAKDNFQLSPQEARAIATYLPLLKYYGDYHGIPAIAIVEAFLFHVRKAIDADPKLRSKLEGEKTYNWFRRYVRELTIDFVRSGESIAELGWLIRGDVGKITDTEGNVIGALPPEAAARIKAHEEFLKSAFGEKIGAEIFGRMGTGILNAHQKSKGKLLEALSHVMLGYEYRPKKNRPWEYEFRPVDAEDTSAARPRPDHDAPEEVLARGGFKSFEEAVLAFRDWEEHHRSADRFRAYDGEESEVHGLTKGRYLEDTKAGRGAFQKEQYKIYVAALIRSMMKGDPPVFDPTAKPFIGKPEQQGLIYTSDDPLHMIEAARQAEALLREIFETMRVPTTKELEPLDLVDLLVPGAGPRADREADARQLLGEHFSSKFKILFSTIAISGHREFSPQFKVVGDRLFIDVDFSAIIAEALKNPRPPADETETPE